MNCGKNLWEGHSGRGKGACEDSKLGMNSRCLKSSQKASVARVKWMRLRVLGNEVAAYVGAYRAWESVWILFWVRWEAIRGFWEEAWLDMAYSLKNKNFSGCCDHDREDSKHRAQPGGHCSSSGEKSRCSDQGGGRCFFSWNFLKVEPVGLANKWGVGCEGVRETSREISRVWVGVHCTVIREAGRDTFGGTKSKFVLAVLNWRCLLDFWTSFSPDVRVVDVCECVHMNVKKWDWIKRALDRMSGCLDLAVGKRKKKTCDCKHVT